MAVLAKRHMEDRARSLAAVVKEEKLRADKAAISAKLQRTEAQLADAMAPLAVASADLIFVSAGLPPLLQEPS